jgi:hypothetical protein
VGEYFSSSHYVFSWRTACTIIPILYPAYSDMYLWTPCTGHYKQEILSAGPLDIATATKYSDSSSVYWELLSSSFFMLKVNSYWKHAELLNSNDVMNLQYAN